MLKRCLRASQGPRYAKDWSNVNAMSALQRDVADLLITSCEPKHQKFDGISKITLTNSSYFMTTEIETIQSPIHVRMPKGKLHFRQITSKNKELQEDQLVSTSRTSRNLGKSSNRHISIRHKGFWMIWGMTTPSVVMWL